MFDYNTSRALQEHRYPPAPRPRGDGSETPGLGPRKRRFFNSNVMTEVAFRLRSLGRRIQHSTK
jgi:hypothetical protein